MIFNQSHWVKQIVFLIFIIPVLGSCQERVRKNILDKKNPIEYVFHISKDSLFKLITLKLNVDNSLLLTSSNPVLALDNIKHLFSQESNKYDFCLFPTYFLGKSKIFIKANGDSIDFMSWFYIHLEDFGSSQTKVSVKTIEPELITGQEKIPTPPHFGRSYKKFFTESTTIEEYELLMKIGKLVGENQMPDLILPNSNKFTTIILERKK